MQGGKNWILSKEMNANRFFRDFHWLEICKNHLRLSMGQKEGSVAMDSVLGKFSGRWELFFEANLSLLRVF